MRKHRHIFMDGDIENKRLFLVQTEFGVVLRVMERDWNGLSAVLRDAWDGKDLASMTKGNRIRASAPHVGIVGHVTQNELLRNLTSTEACNGFGNRFVWIAVKKSSNELPFPSSPHPAKREALSWHLRARIQAGRTMSELTLSPGGRDMWAALYLALSQEQPDMASDFLDRAEAQVMRLTGLYSVRWASRH